MSISYLIWIYCAVLLKFISLEWKLLQALSTKQPQKSHHNKQQRSKNIHKVSLQLDLKLQYETGGDLSNFMENGEWSLLGLFWKMWTLSSNIIISRNARKKKQYRVWMLPRTLCWHYFYHQHAAENSLLFLQSDCSLCFDFFHGLARLHSSTRRWRKADSWWVKGKSLALRLETVSVSQNVRRNVKWCSLIMLDNAARDERHENGGFRLPPSPPSGLSLTIPNNPTISPRSIITHRQPILTW